MSVNSATRDHALDMLDAFAPLMGRQYDQNRNYDLGPGNHGDVSRLSPYIRRRLLLEREAVETALYLHGPYAAEKFIQEVLWRSYFKGWLEQRPAVWADYRETLRDDLEDLNRDRSLRARIEAAEAGRTGIECFDAWVRELCDTGYLHNHARMWFASIWIFTLQLPWRIGADFFYRHLLDGDPASNTLGWRWVAGLHTRGKAYQAQAWNIEKYTDGRFRPLEAEFATNIKPLDHTEPEGLPKPAALRNIKPPARGLPTALILTEEDCYPESLIPAGNSFCATGTLQASHLRSDRAVSDLVQRFETDALSDTARRLGVTADKLRARDPAELVAWAQASGARQICTPYVPQGPLRDWFHGATPLLAQAGIELTEWRRDWDETVWPFAAAGFFKVKQQFPHIFNSLSLAA